MRDKLLKWFVNTVVNHLDKKTADFAECQKLMKLTI